MGLNKNLSFRKLLYGIGLGLLVLSHFDTSWAQNSDVSPYDWHKLSDEELRLLKKPVPKSKVKTPSPTPASLKKSETPAAGEEQNYSLGITEGSVRQFQSPEEEEANAKGEKPAKAKEKRNKDFVSSPNISNEQSEEFNRQRNLSGLQTLLNSIGGSSARVNSQGYLNSSGRAAYSSYIENSPTPSSRHQDLSSVPLSKVSDQELANLVNHFSGYGCSKGDKDRLTCMVCNTWFEARGEPAASGQIAVGRTVMTRVFTPPYPPTVCGVVWEDRQFSWTNDSISNTIPSNASRETLKNVILASITALNAGANGYTHYYAHNQTFNVNGHSSHAPYWAQAGTACYKSGPYRISNHTFCTENGNMSRTVEAVANAEQISANLIHKYPPKEPTTGLNSGSTPTAQ